MPRAAINPGEHLAAELKVLGPSATEAARRLGVPINRILNGQREITADTALRRARVVLSDRVEKLPRLAASG